MPMSLNSGFGRNDEKRRRNEAVTLVKTGARAGDSDRIPRESASRTSSCQGVWLKRIDGAAPGIDCSDCIIPDRTHQDSGEGRD